MPFPPTAGAARDAYILDAIQRGDFVVPWATVRSHTADGHTGEFRVFADGLKVDGVRINVSAALAQQIADLLDCQLPTAKLLDLTWLQRTVTLPPMPQPTTGMDTTAAMVRASNAIDAQLLRLGNPGGLVCTVGKGWILDNAMVDTAGNAKLIAGVPMAVNYGWAFAGTFQGQTWEGCASDPNTSACRVIQGRGFRHDFRHTDYSQLCLLVSKTCFVDGAERDLGKVLQDPTLAPLASHQGPLRVLRQPGVPERPSIVAAAPCVGPGCPQFVTWSDRNVSRASSGGALTWIGLSLVALGFAGGLALLPRG